MIEIKVYNVNPSKLMDEINNSGQEVINNKWTELDTESNKVGEMTLYFDKVNLALVQEIVNSHNPTPVPKLPTPQERIDMLENMILLIMEG